MKKLIILIFTLAVFFALVDSAQAAVNPLINFQGKVTNIDGSELADNTYNFVFRLYTVPSNGSAIWSESLTSATRFSGTISGSTVNASSTTFNYAGASATSTLRAGQYLTDSTAGESALIIDFDTAANTVTVVGTSLSWNNGDSINNRPFVEGGVINENLGTVSDLSGIDFNQILYLEVVFNSEVMQPRKMIIAAAQAFEASRLGGHDADEFAVLENDETVIGEWDFNNVVDVATSSASTALTVVQNGLGNLVEFKFGAANALSVLSDGRVQIGDYTLPASMAGSAAGHVLKINAGGNMYWDADIAGSGGGSGLWASSTNNLFIYQSDAGQVVVIGNNATTSPYDIQFEVEGFSWFDNIGVSAQQELRFYDADSSNYTALRATGTIASNFILTLPDGLGTAGQALLTDDSGNLYWGSPAGFTYVNSGAAGQIPYYETDGSTLSATSSLFLLPSGHFGIGTSSPANMLTVGSESGSQFLVNANGAVVGGVWQAGIINESYGGTGQGAWQSGSLVFATSSDDLDELLIGTNGYILQAVSGKPEWVATSSLGIDFNTIGGMLDTSQGGTGQDSSGWNGMIQAVGGTWQEVNGTANYVAYWTDANTIGAEQYLSAGRGGTGQDFSTSTGFIYLDSGTASASSTIAISNTDLIDNNTGVELTGNILSLDSSGSWTGTLDGYEGADFFALSAWYATTTDALGEGLGNLYWTDQRFDSRLSATTSLPNLSSLAGLNIVGVIATGTWQADAINVAYGGTGLSSISDQSLLVGANGNTISELIAGAEGEVLVINGGQLSWASTSPASAHSVLSVTHSDADATSTLVRGDLLTVKDVSGENKWSRLALGASGYIFYSDGTDTAWASTTVITALGTIAQGTWHGSMINIAYGGTGATTATGARANLDLDEVYEFGVNSTGTSGYLWQSDGSGRGDWVSTSSLGIDTNASNPVTFIGTTTATFDGLFSTSTLSGYQAANDICDYYFSGSAFCRTYDVLVSIEKNTISDWGGSAWVAEGPPGYTSNSNDCKGWTDNSSTVLGAFWAFDSNGGGMGWLTNCSGEKPLACCKQQ